MVDGYDVKTLLFLGVLLIGLSAQGQTRICDTIGTYTLQGSAVNEDTAYRITNTGVTNASASMWNNNTVDVRYDFDFRFKLYQCGGADGLVFVLHREGTAANAGITGGALNYYANTGHIYQQSYAVEFDIYDNNNTYNDPDNSHIALVSNRSPVPIAGPVTITPMLAGCRDRLVRFLWESGPKRFTVYLDDVQILTHTLDIAQNIFGGQTQLNFGFVGSTGAETATQRVIPVSLRYYGPALTITAAGPTRFCAPGQVTLSVPEAAGGAFYDWQPRSTLTTPDDPSTVARPDTATQYIVTVTDATGCVQRDSITVTPVAKPRFTLGPDKAVCGGVPARLYPIGLRPGRYTYAWAPNAQLYRLAPDTVQTFIGQTPPPTVSLTVSTPEGCTWRDTVAISVRPALVVDAGPDLLLCKYDSIANVSVVHPDNGVTYRWALSDHYYPGPSAQIAVNNPYIDSTYIITLSAVDAEGCRGADTVFVRKEFPDPKQLGIRIRFIDAGKPSWTITVLDTSGRFVNDLHVWHFGDGTVDTASADQEITHTFDKPGFNSVAVLILRTGHCTQEYPNSLIDFIYIPNVITPNGDGKNDVFSLSGSFDNSAQLHIYNRYGVEVYADDHYKDNWGADAPAGTYYFRLDGITFQPNYTYRGWLEVVR